MSAVGSGVEEVDPAPTANPADIAKEARMSVVGLHSAFDDFHKVTDQAPFLADLKPSGNARNNFPVTDPMVMLFNHRKHLI
ncbi:hypothetical protein C2845_PM07G15860 [Panicum miliaceum]|uniref:Uncharacterized protein n=1 Tax=Panicum miliaceum TaxID=4540 RepID=A0A3L6SLJ0_PANMI|nr:hypothetical protein C2845_PM07G15860 [Panicum miliaceum]